MSGADDSNDLLAAELRALEERLLDPAVRADAAQLRTLLAPEFIEFGASGRVFDRDAIIAAVTAGGPLAAQQTRRFRVQRLAPGAALTTWRIRHGDGSQTLRSSIWQRIDGRWQLLFHQGTVAAVDDEGTS